MRLTPECTPTVHLLLTDKRLFSKAEFTETPHTKVVSTVQEIRCPTWSIVQFRILAEIRPFEFELLLNKDFFNFFGLILNKIFKCHTIFGPRNLAVIYLNIDRYEYHFFAQSSRLHMYEQTGAKISEIGPVNAEINGC